MVLPAVDWRREEEQGDRLQEQDALKACPPDEPDLGV